jgi:putative Mn2+ efflux pump MntP
MNADTIFQSLALLAQLTIGFAGLSAITQALAPKNDETNDNMDRFNSRLAVLISVAVAVACLVPLGILPFLNEAVSTTIWRIHCFALSLSHIFIITYVSRRSNLSWLKPVQSASDLPLVRDISYKLFDEKVAKDPRNLPIAGLASMVAIVAFAFSLMGILVGEFSFYYFALCSYLIIALLVFLISIGFYKPDTTTSSKNTSPLPSNAEGELEEKHVRQPVIPLAPENPVRNEPHS